MNKAFLTSGLLLALGACSALPASQVTPALTTAGATVLSVASANNTTVAKIVAGGQEFCKYDDTLFALAGVSVTGETAQIVADACAVVNPAAVPVAVDATTAASVSVVPAS